jgi:hypothetical protein
MVNSDLMAAAKRAGLPAKNVQQTVQLARHKPGKNGHNVQQTIQPPALDALKDIAVHSKVIEEKLKGLVLSDNRHGDLQVIRSAALRLVQAAEILIAEEQR